MSVFEVGDRLWERLKARSPRFRAADQTQDQTHTHHALVTVLLFGTLGAGIGLLGGLILTDGLRYGIMGGWTFYLIREVVARWNNWHYAVWDGVGDVLEPLWVTAPVVFQSVASLWILSAIFAAYFFLLRPVK